MEKTTNQDQIKPRRTFAIISHPDAGKTTLTEKLLFFGGAIRLAGTVKGRKAAKYATSDWMQIEKERGISVTSSAMQFSYNGIHINILDTPGHEDFSEDTYRTLMAADSAVMLIDLVKGVEAQTIKLFKVCRMRGIPIFTFINKLDRFGKDPLDVLQEIEDVLGINTVPLNWPVGMGKDFSAIYDRRHQCLELYRDGERKRIDVGERGLEDPALKDCLEPALYDKLCEDLELLDIAGDAFDEEMIQQGMLSPVFFGSALSSIGVQTFLEQFLEMAPEPRPQKSSVGYIQPTDPQFSGFIFKIQANMNPAHRDRIAFMRVCSGRFERGMAANHVRSGKKIKLPQPQQFLAQERDILEEAYPGDVVGLFDPGIFRIGDTLSEEGTFEFEKLPQFAPEYFAKIINLDFSKYKQFQKGIKQLTEEGTVQVFRTFMDGPEGLIVGVVGKLQFEVLEYRLENEYGTRIQLHHLLHHMARWVRSDKPVDPANLRGLRNLCVKDQDDQLVVLLEDEYYLDRLKDKYPEITFHTSSND
ncbi:Peptide chain release factor 3 [Dehalobacter sp. UNSWDHB]|jgi:peptide chain release factor 3|uniref:peptide chain release factor 3 n=1 Tax=unclassified Dehalobacter TaxID=2635733 RepID=UPI00028AE1D8|nr:MULTISPECIES: peptide chain release factor 3 [unclassified Dehalobacter]AFV03141.1 Peptide chain release factor 3 [Dehalobacter sp. DCA]AFV06131.1 Peptide chain release factor 3 [Dehalobacter sp. CF]EQB21103.1 Peptide chain release factor 3 [Dehalobacter sp. UNSWDHB]